jgi:hypothetical protein
MAVTGGLDLAMNHSAAVVISELEIIDFRFLTDKSSVHSPGIGSTLYADKRKSKGPDRDLVLWDRLASFRQWIGMVMKLGSDLGVERWGVENYAFGRGHNAYHIGEVGGVARAAVMATDFGEIELVNVGDVKARAGLSRRSKEKPFAFCLETFGGDWSEYDRIKTSDAGGDLADATVIALITGERMQ